MSNKSRFLICVTAILLIPILLGMTPMNFVQKIGAGCPFSQSKQVLKCNPCPFHSIISQEDHGIANLPSELSYDMSISLPHFQVLNSFSILSVNPLTTTPLRC